MQKSEKSLKPWHMGTPLRELSESYPMNTNTTGFKCFQKSLHSCALAESSPSIGGVDPFLSVAAKSSLTILMISF